MLTDAQISERVCRALGIEPRLRNTCPNYFAYWHEHCTCCKIVPVYESVFDWRMFGIIIAELHERGFMVRITSTFDDTSAEIKDYDEKVGWKTVGNANYMPSVNPCDPKDALPRALAEAVLAWAEEGR